MKYTVDFLASDIHQRNYIKLALGCCDEFEQVSSGWLIYLFNSMGESRLKETCIRSVINDFSTQRIIYK